MADRKVSPTASLNQPLNLISTLIYADPEDSGLRKNIRGQVSGLPINKYHILLLSLKIRFRRK